MGEPAAAFYTAAIVLALEALHGLCCVARTLSPSSVLLDEDGWPLLSDLSALGYVGLGRAAGDDDDDDGEGEEDGACPGVAVGVGVRVGETDGDGEGQRSAQLHQHAAGPEGELEGAGGSDPSGAESSDARRERRSSAPRRELEPTGRAHTVFEPWLFMAPELVRGEASGHGLAADWWSLGALLFAMLVGRAPCESPADAHEPASGGGGTAAEPRAGSGSDHAQHLGRMYVGRVLWPAASEPQLSASARALLVDLLLIPNERKRAEVASASAVRAHRFFSEQAIDFEKLLKREGVSPPWVPKLRGKADLRYVLASVAGVDGSAAVGAVGREGAQAALPVQSTSTAYDAEKWDKYFDGF
jgi:serine/threonine protein kinase